jgi:hypothetical protein
MWKVYLITVFIFSGCSNFTFNTTMCDQIATDPNAVVPQECRNYSEKEAQKAFDKSKPKPISNEEMLEFNKNN